MYIKSEFDQNYSDVYDVKSIVGELKGAFFAVQKVLLLAGKNTQQFLVTGKLDMTSLSEKEAKLIVKCRIKKPGYGNSKGYRAVFFII